jgi:hypothetical protein
MILVAQDGVWEHPSDIRPLRSGKVIKILSGKKKGRSKRSRPKRKETGGIPRAMIAARPRQVAPLPDSRHLLTKNKYLVITRHVQAVSLESKMFVNVILDSARG